VPLLLAACVMEPPPTYSSYRPPSMLIPGGSALPSGGMPGGGTPPLSTAVPAGHGVGLLVPLTGPNAERGDALVKAADLAIAQLPGALALDVHDTGGTPQGAAAGAQAAIASGDGIILGPLTAAETAAVAGPATQAGVPVLAFTTDAKQARPGVWVLGLTPAQQVRRLVGAVTADGKNRFAAVLPQTEFGQAMAAALTTAAGDARAGTPDIHFHDSGNPAIAQTMRDASDYAGRRGPLDEQIRAARAGHDAASRQKLQDLLHQGVPPAPFDALLLADTGPDLAWLSTFIAYYDVGPPGVRVLGPALWADAATRAGATLDGAWYAAPDPALRASFAQAYTAKYGEPALGLADLAYDAAGIAVALLQGGGFSQASLCRPSGFPGVDGALALNPDGTVRRGLAVFEIRGAAASIVAPAPLNLSTPGI
jgi:ABC-type branched-subunit amino acid transport system substrate-binding protein